jgi:hypothetical protein
MRRNIDARLQAESRELSMPVEFAGLFRSDPERVLEFRQLFSSQLDHLSVSRCAQLEQLLRDLFIELCQLAPTENWPRDLMERALHQLLHMSLLVPATIQQSPTLKPRGSGDDNPYQPAIDSIRSMLQSPSLAKLKRSLLRETDRLEAICQTLFMAWKQRLSIANEHQSLR